MDAELSEIFFRDNGHALMKLYEGTPENDIKKEEQVFSFLFNGYFHEMGFDPSSVTSQQLKQILDLIFALPQYKADMMRESLRPFVFER